MEKRSRTHSRKDGLAQRTHKARRSLPKDVHSLYLLRPTLKRGDCEKRHHSRKDIVKIEITILPDPLTDHRVINIFILVENEKPPREEKKCGLPWSDMK